MNTTQPALGQGSPVEKTARQIGSVSWAVFFIWVGIAILANVPWSWFFIGVGILILLSQFARWQMNVDIEVFWLACAAVFLLAGLWTLLELPWPLGAILIILLGIGLLAKTLMDIRADSDAPRRDRAQCFLVRLLQGQGRNYDIGIVRRSGSF